MPLTKNYLRYVHESTFNITAASQAGSSIKFLHMRNTKDRYIAVPANEDVFIWDLKTKQLINKLIYDSDIASEVTVFEYNPKTGLIAIGYVNGHVRVFEAETGGLKVTFTGHRTAISALAFDQDGFRLASGGKDCNIVLWDIVGEKGLFSLKGHKNSISKLAFLYNGEYQKDCIISSSIDAVSTIKIWDLQLQHCFCTIPGQASGVWSFALLKNGTRLVVGSTSPELGVYSIDISTDIKVEHLGNILRNSTTISDRVQDIVIDQDESLMICHSVDKNIELYGLRSQEEALTYAKKQAKKAARKEAKRKTIDQDEADAPIVNLECLNSQATVDCEFNKKIGCFRLPHKVKSLTLTRLESKKLSRQYKIAVVSSSNRIDSFIVDLDADKKEHNIVEHSSCIESISHRSDVRCVSISLDNTLIISASAESVKIWRLETRACLATIDTGYAVCCAFAEAQNIGSNYKNRFALLGTKQGQLQIIDIADVKVVQTLDVCNEGKPLNSIFILPGQTGIVCGGEDGVVRFYNFVWKTIEDEGQKQTCLTLEEDRLLPFQEGITCVRVSSNNNLLAVALLDSTVRVHFMDTFKYFLTMYGHKFPVTTMDISDDNTLIATGSPDKNIKIWGLDFGDCHKSIFAHDEAVTCVRFVPRTHYIFSTGRDKAIKQWDCDHFIKIQTLRKHQAEVWCMAISSNGKYLVTGSHDKSIRMYRKTEEILVPSEEEETERELEDERNVFEKQENIVVGEPSLEVGFATKMTIETVKSADRLIEAIDVFANEQAKDREYKEQCKLADKNGEPRPPEPERDPLLMTMMTTDYERYMLEVIRRIRSSELEQILITLPFDYTRKLLTILSIFLEKSWDVQLMVRCSVFLLKVNFGQLAASPTTTKILVKLQEIILERTNQLRDLSGFNLFFIEDLNRNKRYQSMKVNRDIPLSFY